MPNPETTEPRQPRSGDLIIPPSDRRGEPKRRVRKKAFKFKKVGWPAYLALILITVVVYIPIFNSEIVWSSYDQVERSPFQSMESIGQAWSVDSIRRHDTISITTYFLEQKLPFNPAISHHAINLLLHIGASILLLRVLESLKLPAAFSTSLIFALHPTVIQTIFWSGYRTELIGLILFLYALLLGVRNRNSAEFIALIVFSVIAYLTHPATLVLPLILGLTIFFSNKFFVLKDYNRLLPLVCLALFIGVWTQSGSSELELGFSERAGMAAQNLFFGLQQSILPAELSLFYPFAKAENYGAQNDFLPFLLFIPFFILVACNYRKSWARGAFLGLTAYLLLALYGITRIGSFLDGSPAYEDHLTYITLPAIIALIVCSAGGIARMLGTGGKVLWALGFSLFVIGQIALTSSFALSVSEPTVLWKNISQKWPEAWLPKLALIEASQAEGVDNELFTSQEMVDLLENILEQQPERVKERILLARIYRDQGQSDNALREYKRLLRETSPDDAFLEEAAQFYDTLNLTWDANNARERITSNTIN